MDIGDLFTGIGVLVALGSIYFSARAVRTAKETPHAVEQERQKAVRLEMKIDCVRRVFGLRSVHNTDEWLAALNEAGVVFNDDPAVLIALVAFQRNRTDALLLDVFKRMMDAVGLDRSGLDDEFLMRPFGRS